MAERRSGTVPTASAPAGNLLRLQEVRALRARLRRQVREDGNTIRLDASTGYATFDDERKGRASNPPGALRRARRRVCRRGAATAWEAFRRPRPRW
jgi:hypothetical protein